MTGTDCLLSVIWGTALVLGLGVIGVTVRGCEEQRHASFQKCIEKSTPLECKEATANR